MALRVNVLPMGRPRPKDVRELADALRGAGFEAVVVDGVSVPDAAYDPARRQYRARVLLAGIPGGDGGRVLGVTDVDIYVGGLNFVFGIASARSRAAVISVARLGLGADEDLFRERALKEAAHELGHTLGLSHCPDPGCVMHFSNSLADTDRKGRNFCSDCRRSLGEGGARP